MNDLDPAAIMAEHHSLSDGSAGGDNSCAGDNYDCGYMWPCPTYRLAEALVAEQAKVRYYKAAMITARREADEAERLGAVKALRAAARVPHNGAAEFDGPRGHVVPQSLYNEGASPWLDGMADEIEKAQPPASHLQPMQPGQSSTCWALPHDGPCHYSHLLGDD